MRQQDYWDLGADTERWWREHFKDVMPHLRHIPRCKGYDFKGEFEGHTLFIDVKFTREEYRQKGWIETVSWGSVTGIIETAKKHFYDDTVSVYIAVLAEGRHYLIDAKALLQAWMSGQIEMHTSQMRDDTGQVTDGKYFQMMGWNDDRFCILEGALKEELWKPRTEIGKKVDIEEWMNGIWMYKVGA